MKASPICAYVNNKTEELKYRVFGPKDIEFLDISHPAGMRTYVRSLCFVMYKAINDIIPGTRLRIEHSLSHGYYCLLDNENALEPESIDKIKHRMAEIIAADIPFKKIECHTADAIEVFREQGMFDKIELLKTTHELYTQYHTLDGLADSYYSWLTRCTDRTGSDRTARKNVECIQRIPHVQPNYRIEQYRRPQQSRGNKTGNRLNQSCRSPS